MRKLMLTLALAYLSQSAFAEGFTKSVPAKAKLASYQTCLQRSSEKAELVAQLKHVLRAICNTEDARFQRLRLLLEESYGLHYESDGTEVDDNADPK